MPIHDPYETHRFKVAYTPSHPEHQVQAPKPQPELDERAWTRPVGVDDMSGDDVGVDISAAPGARPTFDRLIPQHLTTTSLLDQMLAEVFAPAAPAEPLPTDCRELNRRMFEEACATEDDYAQWMLDTRRELDRQMLEVCHRATSEWRTPADEHWTKHWGRVSISLCRVPGRMLRCWVGNCKGAAVFDLRKGDSVDDVTDLAKRCILKAHSMTTRTVAP